MYISLLMGQGASNERPPLMSFGLLTIVFGWLRGNL